MAAATPNLCSWGLEADALPRSPRFALHGRVHAVQISTWVPYTLPLAVLVQVCSLAGIIEAYGQQCCVVPRLPLPAGFVWTDADCLRINGRVIILRIIALRHCLALTGTQTIVPGLSAKCQVRTHTLATHRTSTPAQKRRVRDAVH